MVVYPIGGEGLVPGTTERVHWDAYGNTGTFQVQVSVDNGATWTNIASALGSAVRFVNFQVPGTVTGLARVKVTRGAFSDESDANFSIINRPANLEVVAVCTTANTIRLKWVAASSATGYDVFKLGTMYMDSVGTTSGATTFDVPVPNINDSYWFAVRAKGPNNCIGLRTNAVQFVGGNGTSGTCFIDCGNDNDAGIAETISPTVNQQSCNGNDFDVSVLLTNISTADQFNFPVYYRVNGGAVVMQTYNDTLAGGAQDSFTFTQQLTLSAPGVYNLQIWTGLATDGALCNDTMNIAINFSNPIGSFPYTENFQSGTFPPVNAYLINPDGDITWTTKSCTGRNGAATISMHIDNYTYNASGEEDVFGLVSMDLTNAVGAQLTFDLAHAPYSASYTDGLRVELSTDCGQTFNSIYNKSGTQLGTTANTTAVFTPSAAAQWRNEVVDLSTYVGNHVALRFIGVTDYGNDVFIDNINILRFSNPPTAAFTTANTTVCAGTPVTFTDLSTASPSSWSWNFGDGTAVSTQQNPSHTFANGGVYTIRLIANNPAGSDTSEQTAYLTVLEADFSSNASTSALDVDFTDLSFGANNWSWNFGDGASSTAQNPSHSYAAPGTYTVTLLINNNCSKIYQITVGSVAVSEIETNVFEAELMPNPAIEQTKLTLANALSEDLQVELLSVDGRIIRNLILPARLNSLTVDCSQLAPGLYFLRLKTEQLTESIKFVVKK